jgi:CobQ-like glutamine amidotransferase family enzyme/UDP-N-acetylmuramyl tripeptide synthase
MSFRYSLARAASSVSTWGLRYVAHRPAANLPGKIALKIDPQLLDELRTRCTEGSVITVGTNGKTSTNNVIADAFEAAGRTIICNRTGANLAAGIASALLQQPPAQWGVFECDELWLARVLPHLKSNYALLLNLFRDQLDRCGEIDRIQTSIMGALASSPETVLIYNADDPLCARIATEVPNRSIAFGLTESMGLEQNTVVDAQMCQVCNHMISYNFRQYGQLGSYYCEECGFARPSLQYQASQVSVGGQGVSLIVEDAAGTQALHSPQPTAYAAYNLVASWALCHEVGIPVVDFQRATDAFNPRNGRLQRYELDGHPVLLNLAKNPTGFNQNLKIVTADCDPKLVAFFINDNIADGRDISWIWDIDFEELAGQQNLVAFAGGSRAHDVAVRLKYAGIQAHIIESVNEVFREADALARNGELPRNAAIYAIANYTALPPVHEALNAREAQEAQEAQEVAEVLKEESSQPAESLQPVENVQSFGTAQPAPHFRHTETDEPVVIVHLMPDLLNLYGDGGNVRILEQRLRWRGIPVEVRAVHYGEEAHLSDTDLVFMGGGPDREQKLASEQLLAMRDEIASYVEEDGALLAICGGYQILGKQWLWGDELVEGLNIIDMETRRPGTSANRLVDNMVLETPLAENLVVGYENHAGRTYLGEGVEGFGRVVSACGCGNNDDDHLEGARYRNVLGTYAHGPLLSKNPEIADWLLARALERHAYRTGGQVWALAPLNDAEELAANELMVKRLS